MHNSAHCERYSNQNDRMVMIAMLIYAICLAKIEKHIYIKIESTIAYKRFAEHKFRNITTSKLNAQFCTLRIISHPNDRMFMIAMHASDSKKILSS